MRPTEHMQTVSIQTEAAEPRRATSKADRRKRAYCRLLQARAPSLAKPEAGSLYRIAAMDNMAAQGRIPVVRMKEGATRPDHPPSRPLQRRSVAAFNHIRHSYNNYSHYRMDVGSLVLFPPIHNRSVIHGTA